MFSEKYLGVTIVFDLETVEGKWLFLESRIRMNAASNFRKQLLRNMHNTYHYR